MNSVPKVTPKLFSKAFIFGEKQLFLKFDGMWSVAFFNKENNELTLARDEFGIKPLYYMRQGEDFYFASEIKFIHTYIEQPELDQEIAFDFLRYSFMDHCERTFIKVFIHCHNARFCHCKMEK